MGAPTRSPLRKRRKRPRIGFGHSSENCRSLSARVCLSPSLAIVSAFGKMSMESSQGQASLSRMFVALSVSVGSHGSEGEGSAGGREVKMRLTTAGVVTVSAGHLVHVEFRNTEEISNSPCTGRGGIRRALPSRTEPSGTRQSPHLGSAVIHGTHRVRRRPRLDGLLNFYDRAA